MSQGRNKELSFSDEQSMILDSARQFCRDQSDISAVRALLSSDEGYSRKVWADMVELGWLGLAIPEQFGGSGLGIGATVPLAECMGRHLLSTPYFSCLLASEALRRAGTDAQKQEFLPAIASGEVATLALLDSEDWGAPGFTSTAEEEGDSLRLSGQKWYVSDAVVADLLVVAVEFGGAPVLVLVLPEQLPEGAMQAHLLIDETKRAAKLDLEGVVVPRSAQLDPALTDTALRDLRLIGALLVAAEATGSAAACLDTVVEYLKTRKQFGKLIGSYQALKHPTVDLLCAMDHARSLIYHAATIVSEDTLDRDAEIACRMAKAQATEALLFAGDRAVQFHGAMGFTYDCDAQLYIRRAQWAQQQFGDARHHRKRLADLLL
ncbi:MAG: acyl-CoA dehydrogenase family protein [Pseudomonadales bacterium]